MAAPFEKAIVHINGEWENAEYTVVTQPYEGISQEDAEERRFFIWQAIKEKIDRERSGEREKGKP